MVFAQTLAAAKTVTSIPAPAGPFWPTVSKIVTTSPGSQHNALDIAGNVGDPVFSPVAGTVTAVKNQPGGYGLNIRVLTEGGKELIFGHLSGVNVTPGQKVSAGQTIGGVGSTGNSTGPHLHFEVKQPGPDSFAGGLSNVSALNPYTLLGLAPSSVPITSGSTVSLKGSTGTLLAGSPSSVASAPAVADKPVVARTPEGDFVINTPLGAIDIDFPWQRILALIVGIVLVWIGAFMLARPAIEKVTPKIIKAAAGTIPGVGAAQAILD